MITGAFPNLMAGLAGFIKSAAQMEMERRAFLQARDNAEAAYEIAKHRQDGVIIDGECEDVTGQALLAAKPRFIGG